MKRTLQITSPVPFQDSDALLLLSTVMACGSSAAGLGGIVDMSDSVSGNPISFEQLDGGIARLQAAGLVDFDGEKVRPTPHTFNVIESLSDHYDSAETLCVLVNDLLRRDAPAMNPGDPLWTTAQITRRQFDAF